MPRTVLERLRVALRVNEWLGHSVQRVTIRFAVWVGFLIVLALWGYTTFSLLGRIGGLQEDAAAARRQYTEQESLLSRVEHTVLVGGIYLRDAIIDSDPGTIGEYRRRLAATRGIAEDAVAEYYQTADSARSDPRFTDLHRQLTEYWIEVEKVAGAEVPLTAADSGALLRRWVIPKREDLLRISENVRELNRHAFEDALRGPIADLYAEFYRRAWFSIGVTGLVTLLVAFVVIGHASGLERRIREQQAKDAETAQVLHRLSASLVQAQETERRTIARELHDEVGQALTAIRVELSVARRGLPDDGPAARSIEEARAISEQALRGIRDLSQLLHPTVLDDLGLVTAVESLLEGFSRRTGVGTTLAHEGLTERLPGEFEVAAYRIVQEGLTNISRHADARHVHVTLRRRPDALAIGIEDDGRGFDMSAQNGAGVRSGLGLVGIEERAKGFGGTFRVDSAPWRGTRLKVEVPIVTSTDAAAS